MGKTYSQYLHKMLTIPFVSNVIGAILHFLSLFVFALSDHFRKKSPLKICSNRSSILFGRIMGTSDLSYRIFQFLGPSFHDGVSTLSRIGASSKLLYKCIERDAFVPLRIISKISALDALEWIVKRCPNCEQIDASSLMLFLSDDALRLIASKCPKLSFLDLTGNKNVSDEGLVAISLSCPLVRLKLTSCGNVSDKTLCDIAPLLRNSLTDLDLINCRVTDKGLAVLSQHCNHLRRLDISNLENITKTGLMSITRHCQLRSLIAIKCTGIKDEGVAELSKSQNASFLEEIVLSRTNISDGSLILLLKIAPNLRLIDVTHNEQISDESIFEIAKHCPSLQILRVSFCPRVTDVSITEIALHCQSLTSLFVRDCWSVTEDSLQILRERVPPAPNCKIYDF